jgi:heme exporter protein C
MSIPTATKQSWWTRLAHPGEFVRMTSSWIAPLSAITAVLFALGLWFAFFNSPEDYQMGDTVRIMYAHVPNAWLSQFVYGVMAVSALGTLVWRHPMADVSMKAAAPLGALFTALALYTGALWGRPTWGTFWEWDGRMTSTLVLLFIYLGIMALWRNIPIIKFSVDWWSTLHQPASVFRADGPRMPPSILTPLFLMFFAFTFLFVVLQLKAMHTEVKRRRVRALERQVAQGAAG